MICGKDFAFIMTAWNPANWPEDVFGMKTVFSRNLSSSASGAIYGSGFLFGP